MPSDLIPSQTFNWHIRNRIFRDRDPRLKVFCDKLAVRNFIRDRVGNEFVVPLLGVWADIDHMNWSALPQQFVLKPSHASGMAMIVERKDSILQSEVDARTRYWLSTDHFDRYEEWGYRNIPRHLLAEPLLRGPNGGELVEIQVFVFGGVTKVVRILTGTKGTRSWYKTYFDESLTLLPFTTGNTYSPSRGQQKFPFPYKNLLFETANRVAEGLTHLRVDFYLTNDGLKIGELTPYTAAGAAVFDPPEWDRWLGQFWPQDALAKRDTPDTQDPDELMRLSFARRRDEIGRQLQAVLPRGTTMILADEQWFDATKLAPNRHVYPFVEKDGQYWGNPVDSDHAMKELNRLMDRGVQFFVIVYPCFWWMDYYPGFIRRLRSRFRCLLDNNLLIIFDLR